MSNNDELMTRLTLLLDGCLDLLDREAEKEKRREADKPLRSITMQQRAEAAREVVGEAAQALGLDLGE